MNMQSVAFLNINSFVVEIGIKKYQKWVFQKRDNFWRFEGVYAWNGDSWVFVLDGAPGFITGGHIKALALSCEVLTDTENEKIVCFSGSCETEHAYNFTYTLECRTGIPWVTRTVSVCFQDDFTSMETGTFGTSFSTLDHTNVRNSIIMSYMPDEKVKAFSESMPAAAVMLRGSYGYNFVIDHYSMESSDQWPVFSITDIPCSKERVWLEVVSTPGTFKANHPYTVKSDIYIVPSDSSGNSIDNPPEIAVTTSQAEICWMEKFAREGVVETWTGEGAELKVHRINSPDGSNTHCFEDSNIVQFRNNSDITHEGYVYKIFRYDVHRFPYLSIRIHSLSGGAKWKLLAVTESGELEVQAEAFDTGVFTCDLGKLLAEDLCIENKQGPASLTLKLFILGRKALGGLDWIEAFSMV